MEKLVNLPEKGKCVIVGDTHGDFEATRLIIKNFINKKNHYLVFLGDYVDRGPNSKENINYLLETQEKHENLILLVGNHEMYPIVECSPCDFWESLTEEEFKYYKEKFLQLPYCVAGRGFIAVHAAVPDVEKIENIEDIEVGSEKWYVMLWGDFVEKEGEYIGSFLGRPQLGKGYFEKVMARIKKNVLIRSHDPKAKEKMFQGRCLTIFTSSAYGRERKFAIVDLSRELKTSDDIELVSLDYPSVSL